MKSLPHFQPYSLFLKSSNGDQILNLFLYLALRRLVWERKVVNFSRNHKPWWLASAIWLYLHDPGCCWKYCTFIWGLSFYSFNRLSWTLGRSFSFHFICMEEEPDGYKLGEISVLQLLWQQRIVQYNCTIYNSYILTIDYSETAAPPSPIGWQIVEANIILFTCCICQFRLSQLSK